MAHADLRKHKLGWIGTGRMGFPMAGRLLKKGADVAVYNRTRAKAEPLVPAGGRLVDSPAALADRDIVFTMVSTSDDLLEVTPQTLRMRKRILNADDRRSARIKTIQA